MIIYWMPLRASRCFTFVRPSLSGKGYFAVIRIVATSREIGPRPKGKGLSNISFRICSLLPVSFTCMVPG